MGIGRDFGYRVDSSQHVRHMAHPDHFVRSLKSRPEGIHIQTAVGCIDHTQDNALAAAQQLPWHNIGMMLHNGKYDFIVVLKEAAVASTQRGL